MILLPLPDRPWQRLGADLFELKGVTYLLVVDYYSRYPEVIKLTSLTSKSVITALRSIFSRHGIPEVLTSDNGPQFDSQEFQQFAQSYGFQHTTSSPHYPQGNGLAERTVKTVKSLFNKEDDHNLALLSYRATPFPWCGLSPSQLLMGRQPRTTLPQTESQLTPQWSFLTSFRPRDEDFLEKQKQTYDKRHRARSHSGLPNGTQVWIKTNTKNIRGSILLTADTPRSYWVNTPSGKLRRNHRHLTTIPDPAPIHCHIPDTSVPDIKSPTMTRSTTNTEIRSPERFHF